MSTALLQNPFMNSADVVMPAADRAGASTDAPEAPARFDQHFDPEKFLRDIAIGLPVMSAKGYAAMMREEEIDRPAFLGDPSIEFTTMIEDMHRDVLSLLEDHARRAG